MFRKVAVVLGGSGFIGSHVVDILLQNNFKVVNIDLNGRDLKHKDYQEHLLNLCDNSFGFIFSSVLKTFRPSVVFNFVSMMSIKQCNDSPKLAIENNILSNVRILNIIKFHNDENYNSKIELFVYASSVYAGSNKSGVYGITKRATEDYIKHFCGSNKLDYLILRYGTVYGPRSTDENSIYSIIKSALETKKISFYGTGDEVREYVHVKDVAQTTLSLTVQALIGNELCRISNKIYFISGTRSLTSKELGGILQDILGSEYSVEFRQESSVGHYNISPYNYEDLPLKYNCGIERELGAGLLEMIDLLKDKINEEQTVP